MNMQYDDLNHIHAVSAVINKGSSYAYAYDENGNQLSGPDMTDPDAVATRNLVFNADNMPVTVAHPVGGTVGLTYDGEGKRARKSGAGKETYYFSNEFEIIDGVETFYVFAGNLRVAMVKNNQPAYFHKDHLGSSTAVTDQNGAIVETGMYMPYGGKRGAGGISASAYKFTDQELDKESGLYNYDARLYDPIIGRFVSADTFVPDFSNSQAYDRYAYTLNNPIKYTDPSGHFVFMGTLGTIAAYKAAVVTINVCTAVIAGLYVAEKLEEKGKVWKDGEWGDYEGPTEYSDDDVDNADSSNNANPEETEESIEHEQHGKIKKKKGIVDITNPESDWYGQSGLKQTEIANVDKSRDRADHHRNRAQDIDNDGIKSDGSGSGGGFDGEPEKGL